MNPSIQALLDSYQLDGDVNQSESRQLPSQDRVRGLLKLIQSILFPGYFVEEPISSESLVQNTISAVDALTKQLLDEILKSFNVSPDALGSEDDLQAKAQKIVDGFIQILPTLRRQLKLDRQAIYMGDPAAKSDAEILLAYPGFHAIMTFRIATYFFYQNVPLIPRIMSELAHSATGIEIHPGAKIGSHFCIDHGTGVVIGESTVIGDFVKIYQGVTLGALSVKDRNLQGQRHPTIEDNVTIYSGTTILGGETRIGCNSVIGGNVWLTRSIPPHSKVYICAEQKKTQIEKVGEGVKG